MYAQNGIEYTLYKSERIPKRRQKKDNPEKLATYGTQDDTKTKQKYNTSVEHHYTQRNTNNVNKT